MNPDDNIWWKMEFARLEFVHRFHMEEWFLRQADWMREELGINLN